jgi:uncharacterized protein
MSQRRLSPLTVSECFALLNDDEVGRLIFVDDVGPAALPVNYAVDGESIVFRIEHSSKQFALRAGLAFEVDRINRSLHSGWSVLVRGTAQELTMDEAAALVHRVKSAFPRPWAEGVHNVWMKLTPTEVTGRRLEVPANDG